MKFKSIYLLILAIGLGFYSCSSDDKYSSETPEEVTMQTVSFEFPEFSQSVSTRSANASSPTDNYSFNYYVFRKGASKDGTAIDGDLVKTKWFPKGGIANIKDTLPVGDYYISIFASTANSLTDDCTFIALNYHTMATMEFSKFTTDILYQTFELTVGNDAVQKPVTLERVVSKVEIVIEDLQNMPADIFVFSVSSEDPTRQIAPSSFLFKNKQTIFTDRASFLWLTREQVLASDSSNPLSFYVFPTKRSDGHDKFGISISLLEKPNINGGFPLVAVKVIKKDIKIGVNETVRLTGKLFDNNINSNITLESVWGNTVSDVFDPQ